MVTVRNRVVGLRYIPANQLLENPRNWRRHPQSQVNAIRGVLSEIGFADVLLARETENGLELVDGHLRRDVMGEQEVPVVVLDLDGEEADKLLVTLDPLAAMAQPDQDALLSLLESVSFESKAINEMLEALANGETAMMPDFEPTSAEDQGRLDEKKKVICPECSHEFTP